MRGRESDGHDLGGNMGGGDVVSAGKGFGSGGSESRGHSSVLADIGAKALEAVDEANGGVRVPGCTRGCGARVAVARQYRHPDIGCGRPLILSPARQIYSRQRISPAGHV